MVQISLTNLKGSYSIPGLLMSHTTHVTQIGGRRISPPRATKSNNKDAKENNLYLKATLGSKVGRNYRRVVAYSPNHFFDAEKPYCKKENVGQFIASLFLKRGDWWVWRSETGAFVIFKSNCDTTTKDMYDIEPLREGEEKFSSYEALAVWAHGNSGFFEEHMKNSNDDETKAFMGQLGLAVEEEKIESR